MIDKPKMVIAGGSGFFGSYLMDYFSSNYQIIILSRSASEIHKEIRFEKWDAKTNGEWVNSLENTEVLINLTGKSINCRFTRENKGKLLSSRIDSTKVLREAIKELNNPPKIWLNASAGAMYRPSKEPNIESNKSINSGFLSEMANAWEEEFFKGDLPQTRRAAMRISLLLGKSGGVFPVWKKLTKLFLGGKSGDGTQMVSWMHIEDAARAIEFIINNQLGGPINFSSNAPLTNNDLMKTLREQLKVSFGFPAPEFAIKLAAPIIGLEPSLLLDSVNFIPNKLNKAGFQFKYNKFEEACSSLINE